ncbi:hypothetical protein CLV80_113113 [Yoonia maritima]|uniref:DUF262 domain-containing protein n=1 Tax=Yoonia maritima TaxID=1435347 RepID=A0A2T0VVB4_9RHOB|nr:hypothetical protein [Yoonia maritima]PRY75303.1 hypothetical protein CLV80_113113 [Yoonia maritima]
MTLQVIDTFEEGNAKGYFCRVGALDFIDSLPIGFKDYFVQRGIVSNRYLDTLWETLEQRLHIPIIVVVGDPSIEDFPNPELVGNWKILDGLQRTNRLKIIVDTARFIDQEITVQTELFTDGHLDVRGLTKHHRSRLNELGCPPVLFAKMVRTKAKERSQTLLDLIAKNTLWLEVWVGLTENEQIKKMLLLNAGHKSVSIKHQIELLFSSYLPIFEEAFPGGIVREREQSSTAYSKRRTQGQFFFAHLVTAFESLKLGQPVSTNAEFAAGVANENQSSADTFIDISEADLRDFSGFLVILDNEFSEDIEIRWLGREVVLAGLFAAIGVSSKQAKVPFPQIYAKLTNDLPSFKKWLDLDEFEVVRNSQDTGSVNIGNMNKNAVMLAVKEFLDSGGADKISWDQYFRPDRSELARLRESAR